MVVGAKASRHAFCVSRGQRRRNPGENADERKVQWPLEPQDSPSSLDTSNGWCKASVYNNGDLVGSARSGEKSALWS